MKCDENCFECKFDDCIWDPVDNSLTEDKKEYFKRYYQEHKEQIHSYRRKYYQERKKERKGTCKQHIN